MDNTVLDKQELLEWMREFPEVTNENAIRHVERGRFNILNPLQIRLNRSERKVALLERYVDKYVTLEKHHQHWCKESDRKIEALQQQVEDMKRALERARNTMEDALSAGEERYIGDFDEKLRPWCDLTMSVDEINVTLKSLSTTEPSGAERVRENANLIKTPMGEETI